MLSTVVGDSELSPVIVGDMATKLYTVKVEEALSPVVGVSVLSTAKVTNQPSSHPVLRDSMDSVLSTGTVELQSSVSEMSNKHVVSDRSPYDISLYTDVSDSTEINIQSDSHGIKSLSDSSLAAELSDST